MSRQPVFMQEDKNPASAPGVKPPAREDKPWPMIRVVIAILVYAVIQMAVLLFG